MSLNLAWKTSKNLCDRMVGMKLFIKKIKLSFRRRSESFSLYSANSIDPDLRRDDGRGSEQGNVFFYILIAIALFAALSYAVSRNNSGSTNIFTDEQAKLAAQEIIEYGNTVANAVQKLRLRGCSDTEISFQNNIVGGYINTPPSPADNSCHVFETNGGNINFNLSNDAAYIFSGSQLISNAGDGAIGDLAIYLRDVPNDVCSRINQSLNITSNNVIPTDDGTQATTLFTGNNYATGAAPNDDDPIIENHLTACVYATAEDENIFYQVLIAR